MKKRKNSIVANGDDFSIELSTSLKGSFDWRNEALARFLIRAVYVSRDFFESLPEDSKKLDDEVCGAAWKEGGRVLGIMEKDGRIDKLLADIKKDIGSIPW